MEQNQSGEKASGVEADRQILRTAQGEGFLPTLRAYLGLSGPGWLQSALTLGGGSLGGSLYLGILAGTSLLWLQPLAMILGVIMLSAISYVTLSTGKRPFRAINEHINPVLGWSWILATLMANMVWSMPQYSLCFAVFEQNLFPEVFQGDGLLAPGDEGSHLGKWVVSAFVLFVCTIVTWSYGSGSWGIKLYEILLKWVVALIVLCFIGVVARMSFTGEGIDWGAALYGFIPNLNYLYQPVATFDALLDTITDTEARRYWSDLIVSQQRDVMLAAGAAAVGINMTFLLPYSLLARGWDKTFRGLSIFDLSTGMFIPFILATSCIVIASAQQFHTKLPDGFVLTTAGEIEVPEKFSKPYEAILAKRASAAESGAYDTGPASNAERLVAATLVKRDTYDLAKSLEKLFDAGNEKGNSTGKLISNVVFGVGVIAMTMSSISLMMLISGFVICEVLDRPATGWIFRLGCMASSVGVLWPLVWGGGARAWLTVIAGVYGAMLLPIAYATFYVMMNKKSLLGDSAPTGVARLVWNTLMGAAVIAASAAGISAVYKKAGTTGIGFVIAYIAVVLVVQFARRGKHKQGVS